MQLPFSNPLRSSNKAVIINVAKGIHLRKVEKNISQAKNSLKLLFVFKLNFLSKFLITFVIYLCVVVREQLAEASSLLLPCRPRTRTQASVLGGKRLYLLSHLTCTLLSFNQNNGHRSSEPSAYSGVIRSPFMAMNYIYQDDRFDIPFKAS